MRSMTAYGRKQMLVDGRELTVEIKTVNHRFLDIAFRLPRAFAFAEDGIRKQMGECLKRGHADVNMTYRNSRSDARELVLDEALVNKYADAYRRIGLMTGCEEKELLAGISAFIAAQPDVLNLSVCEEDQEAVQALIGDALADVLSSVCSMRETEGQALKEDLTFHLNQLAAIRDQIETLAPKVPKAYQEKLQARLAELGVKEIDPARLAQEVALMADRCAIDEELSRLVSHIAQMRATMEQDGEVGRRLDFLTQELNREVNTIGSKASDAEIAKLVVAAKSEIEKIREQVQNVE